MSTPRRNDEYVWHFRLGESEEPRADSEEALIEMVRQQIAALLRCVQFTSDGRPVNVTGFRFLADSVREHRISSASGHAAAQDAD